MKFKTGKWEKRVFLGAWAGAGALARALVLAAIALLVTGCDISVEEEPENYWFYHQGAPAYPAITAPAGSTLNAAGSFTISGNAKNDYCNYVAVAVSKNGESARPEYFYMIRGNAATGDFSQAIHLRYGSGVYTVTVYSFSEIKINLNGEGAFSGGGLRRRAGDVYTVTNTAEGDADSWELLPSDDVQIDAEITALKNTIFSAAGIGEGSAEEDKMRAINKWVVLNLSYDDDSLPDGRRKKQDALSVLHNKTGVCEGYANLTMALARAAGIRSRYIASSPMNHGWMQVKIGGVWKMVDATWNDVKISGVEFTAANWDAYIQYTEKYLLLGGNTGVNNDHTNGETDMSRQIAAGG
jgi:hypothetical protein